jgi:hypothetical protein
VETTLDVVTPPIVLVELIVIRVEEVRVLTNPGLATLRLEIVMGL